ncbi:Hypothetical protein PHPALM_11829 [Phytophthora palmivora]|uniref:Uncharacterized protein n=1 Tax=Phytophthora palmivora TaxID=4796 RepID=A0A2P4Y1I3_9STRA|nr:Hypothetical protein PHPALM_11829 [Phytophthora palmivora]
MQLVLSTGEVVFCFCSIALALYLSPLFIGDVSFSGSSTWEFLLIWDDKENFLDNEVIQSGISLENLYAMFTMTKINVYEPFGWILKAIQVQVVGLNSWSVRLVSAALHFMAAVVLARASALLLNVMALLSDFTSGVDTDENTQERREKSHWYGCCISAMIFAIHPVHVEVIGWPSAQPYTLCALFSNLTMFVYVRAVYRKLCGVSLEKKNARNALMSSIFSGHGRNDLLCCGLYLSALLSKSVCVLLPASLFLVDIMPHLPRPSAKQWWSYIVGKLPVVATLLAFVAVMLASNYNGMHLDADVLSLTLGERMIKAMTMPVWVLHRVLWPAKLRPHYQLRPGELSLANPDYLLSLSASMALVLVTLWLFRYRHAPQHLLALAYFGIMVLPVSGLIQHGMVSAGCDRYAYLCSVVVVPYGGSLLAQHCFGTVEDAVKIPSNEHPEHAQDQQKTVGIGITFLLVGTLLFISASLMGNWRNEDVLLEYSLRMDPTDWRILDQRATFIHSAGRCSSDDEECRQLWELSYYFTPVGTLKSDLQRIKHLVALNELDRACENYSKLLELRPDNCHVHNNVGVCLVHQGELSEARREFERAMQTPGYEHLYAAPRKNLEELNKWIALKEDAQIRGEEDTVPQMKSKIMY